MMHGESWDNIINNVTDFKEINSCRNQYFINGGKDKSFISNKCKPCEGKC